MVESRHAGAGNQTELSALLSSPPCLRQVLSHFRTLCHCYVNCFIYLVCFMAQRRSATPTLAGDSASIIGYRMLNLAAVRSSGFPLQQVCKLHTQVQSTQQVQWPNTSRPIIHLIYVQNSSHITPQIKANNSNCFSRTPHQYNPSHRLITKPIPNLLNMA